MAEFLPTADYQGKVLACGIGAYDWDAPAYEYNLVNFTANMLSYLNTGAADPNHENGEGGGTDIGDPSESNGDFENWTGGKPNNWSTSSTAGNATLSQSTDAHGGKYSVEVTGTSSANKRLGYREMTLPAGTYTMKFYTKAATTSGGSVRPGYVPVTDGKVGNYVYGDYTNDLTQSSWVLVTHEFTLNEETTLCLVVMNSKKPGANVLIDDFTLTDAAGNVYIK